MKEFKSSLIHERLMDEGLGDVLRGAGRKVRGLFGKKPQTPQTSQTSQRPIRSGLPADQRAKIRADKLAAHGTGLRARRTAHREAGGATELGIGKGSGRGGHSMPSNTAQGRALGPPKVIKAVGQGVGRDQQTKLSRDAWKEQNPPRRRTGTAASRSQAFMDDHDEDWMKKAPKGYNYFQQVSKDKPKYEHLGYHGANQPVPSIDPELLDDSNAKLMEYEKKSKAYWERARMGSELLGGKKMSPKERRKTSLTKTRKDRKRDAKRSEASKKRAEAKKNAPEPEWSPLDDPTHYL
tara:strand:- start:997 stop:1878 length:882 start_codon:yes stop_codon:yes gene_type:complete